jgi:Flp pilus assembly protein TadD
MMYTRSQLSLILAAAIACWAILSPALAIPSGSPEGPSGAGAAWPATGSYSKPSEYRRAMRLLKADQYDAAIPLLLKAKEKSPNDPDILNELGYAYRQVGKMETALQYYNQALEINPDHKEAREYLGELYLKKHDLANAQAQLAELQRICPAGCEARTDLEKAIAAYQAKP